MKNNNFHEIQHTNKWETAEIKTKNNYKSNRPHGNGFGDITP